jgi:hypothetical protein
MCLHNAKVRLDAREKGQKTRHTETQKSTTRVPTPTQINLMFALPSKLRSTAPTFLRTSTFLNGSGGDRGSVINFLEIYRMARKIEQLPSSCEVHDQGNDFFCPGNNQESWSRPEEIFVVGLDAGGEVCHDIWAALCYNTLNFLKEPRVRDRDHSSLVAFAKRPSDIPCKNHCSSSKLRQHPVHHIRCCHCLSLEHNHKPERKHMHQAMKPANRIGNLIDEVGKRLRIEAAIKGRGEDDKYPQVDNVKEFLLTGQPRNMCS